MAKKRPIEESGDEPKAKKAKVVDEVQVTKKDKLLSLLTFSELRTLLYDWLMLDNRRYVEAEGGEKLYAHHFKRASSCDRQGVLQWCQEVITTDWILKRNEGEDLDTLIQDRLDEKEEKALKAKKRAEERLQHDQALADSWTTYFGVVEEALARIYNQPDGYDLVPVLDKKEGVVTWMRYLCSACLLLSFRHPDSSQLGPLHQKEWQICCGGDYRDSLATSQALKLPEGLIDIGATTISWTSPCRTAQRGKRSSPRLMM